MIDFGIIAAGDGNRIKEEGSKVSKPLVSIDGEPMIARLIKIMTEAGADSISIVINSGMTEVIEFLEDYRHNNFEVSLKILETRTPSSMHTFYELSKLMNPEDKFIVSTVDTIFRKEEFLKYVDTFRSSPKFIDGLMGVTDYIDDEKPLYVETGNEMKIIGYKDTEFEGVEYVSAGIYGLDVRALPVLNDCLQKGLNRMRNFQRALIESGLNLKAFNLGKVIDVDHLEDVEKANNFLK